MPYISKKDRKIYDDLIVKLAQKIAKKNIDNCTLFCGDWNYTITKLIKETLKAGNIGLGYGDWNEVIGMLECCKLEFYRKGVAPYENKKIMENGEV